MDRTTDDGAVIARVTESHELVETLKTEIFAGEEKQMAKRVVHKLLFYFLITLLVGCIIGMLYSNWQTGNRLSLAKKSGILMLDDGSLYQLTPMPPKN
jgi:hypothetical protein